MKWVTHIAWGLLVLYMLGVPLQTAAALATAHTVVTDLIGHSGLRRNKIHDIASVVVGAALAGPVVGIMPGLASGITHVVLDLMSPGKLAVAWWYNAIFLATAGLLFQYLYLGW